MKKSIAIGIFLLLLSSCRHHIAISDINKINGYWEIEKVILPDGSQKQYSFNDTYDYFQISNGRGFRKKVMPQLDGTFLVNDISEHVAVVFDGDKTILKYATPYANWNEELEILSNNEMVVCNAQKREYHYKKAGALNFMGNGKKTK